MASFTLSLLFIPYAIIVAIFLIFGLLNVYHLVYYGATTKTSFAFTFAFIAGAVAIFTISWWFLKDFDWSRQVVLSFFGGAAPAGPADLNGR